MKGSPELSRRIWLAAFGAATLLTFAAVNAEEESQPVIRITLNRDEPAKSRGRMEIPGAEPVEFPVGYGRHGVMKEGSRFKGGYSLLGKFRVNAILSNERFEMAPALIAESGKPAEWLKENLFANMSSIDFDGDGQGGEYGHAFIGLEPLSETPQPFGFHPYKGVYRWYSYALHGTQDEARVGKCVTGGCVNLRGDDLEKVLRRVQLGDLVEVRAE